MPVSYAQILKDVQSRMGGRANASSSDQYVSAINEGLAEVWKALVQTADDFFLQSSTTVASQTNTFAALSTTVREYTLPADCLRPRFIEVISPVGYERVQFVYRKIHSSDFTQQRNASTATGPSSSSSSIVDFQGSYFYTVGGKNTFILARYPEQPFVLKIWYVRALPLLQPGSSLDETVVPFTNDITTFAVKRLQSINAPEQFAIWVEAWRSAIISTVQSAGPRADTNPVFSEDANY